MVRRLLSVIVVLGFVGILFAQEVAYRHITSIESSSADTVKRTSKSQAPQRRRIDFMADVVKPYNDGSGDSIVYFVGNFAAHHNGAVISCDSAVRYSDQRWGFFDRVLINQDSIYIYGDSALYDGDASMAEIFAPIIKVVDGDALLYTYNFRFNTEQKIGTYTDGGVLVHDDNIIESVRGYYDAENHDIICVERVELHGDDYDMKSDSIIYNTDTEFAQFFTQSEIWNSDGDYLAADAGQYDKQQDLYMVTRNGYILTKDQEVWGDTLSYYRSAGHVIGYGNIQMDDFKQKMMAFGDYAEYWSEPGNALLTRNPSAISYDLSQSDSVFMRADTLEIYTINLLAEREEAERKIREEEEVAEKAKAEAEAQRQKNAEAKKTSDNAATVKSESDSAQNKEQDATVSADNQTVTHTADEGQNGAGIAVTDNAPDSSTTDVPVIEGETVTQDTVVEDADSVAQDSVAQLTEKQLKALEQKQLKEAARKAKEAKKREKAAIRKAKLDTIAKQRQAKVTAMLDKMKAKELERMAKDSVRRAIKREKVLAKGGDVAALDSLDSLTQLRNERVLRQLEQRSDSTTVEQAQPEVEAAEGTVSPTDKADSVIKSDSISADSVYRLVKAFRNVKMFRKDAQMVCDSLVSSSMDSIVYLYKSPVLWNGSNQMASQMMILHTHNQKLERAIFDGEPIMVAVIDSTYFNQVAGKKMIAYFRDNEIYRNDVDGNVQTIYFQREDEQTTLVTEMIYIESASASFYIEDKQLVGMTYRNDVPFTMYPINMVPESQPLKLPNFKWVPSLRPTMEGVFDRVIRPSRREEGFEHHRPTFGIVQRMDRRKELLIRTGEWVDREDELTPEIVEWRDTRNLQ